MEDYLILSNSFHGRDKILRLMQFTTKLVWSMLEMNGVKDVSRLKSLEESLNTTRKALQLGRFVDSIQAARKSVKMNNPYYRITLTMNKISYAMYLISDHFVWFGRIGLLDVDRPKWFKRSMKFWLYGSIMNLIRDAYEVQLVLEKKRRIVREYRDIPASCFDCHDTFIEVLEVLQEHPALAVDTLKNSCDAFIPLNSLNQVKLSPQVVSLLGVTSSVCALLQIVKPSLRLNPS